MALSDIYMLDSLGSWLRISKRRLQTKQPQSSPVAHKVQLLHLRPLDPPDEDIEDEDASMCFTEMLDDSETQRLTPKEYFCKESPRYSHLFYLPGCQPDIKISVIADPHNQSYIQKESPYLATEYSLMKSAAHPHVVKTFGFVADKDQHVIVMEHCSNGDLLDRLRMVGGLSESSARRIMRELVSALQHCHRLGIAHLDVKPENVFFDKDFSVRLGDFGHARRVSVGLLRNFTLGTPEYMAPEIHAREPYDGLKADIFSTGIVLFMLLTAHHPFFRAVQSDVYFTLLQTNPARFWAIHEEKLQGETKKVSRISPDFKDLVCGMTQEVPSARMTWREVISHVWMRGQTASQEELCEELSEA